MHLIKLCVGVDALEELAAWQAMRLETQRSAGVEPELAHRTRQMPRQRDAILDGGSLYWVIKGVIRARQRIIDLREETDAEGRTLCAIVFDPALIATRPQPRRPFQGWRYLKPEDAPTDIGALGAGDLAKMPEAMRAELAELALI
ncbi:MAG: DUF1489 family protein [Rhodomicrobiaceae bacterium]